VSKIVLLLATVMVVTLLASPPAFGLTRDMTGSVACDRVSGQSSLYPYTYNGDPGCDLATPNELPLDPDDKNARRGEACEHTSGQPEVC